MAARLAALVALALLAVPASAQNAPPRIGAGIDVVAVPLRAGERGPGLELGLRGRVALPINSDLSAAASVGLSTPLGGQTVLTATPQLSFIVTLPRSGRSVRYLLGGVGGYIPFKGGGSGPTIHAGIGWAQPLSETSLYFEIDPALVVGSDEITVIVPARVGVIF